MIGPVPPLLLSIAVLWALKQGPPEARAKITNYVAEEHIPLLIRALQGLIGISLARIANRIFSRMALQHWHITSPSASRWDWPNEVAVVTGGCSGFGLQLTSDLVDMGVKVAVVDVQNLTAELKPLTFKTDNQGKKMVTFFQYDLCDIGGITDLSAQIRKDVGVPSILINNAGIGAPKTIIDTSDEYLDKIFKINIMCHFKLIKEFMPAMIKANKGHIIEIASAASFVTLAKITDYCATKAGVMSLWEGLNQEITHVHKTPGVVATVVHPAWAATPLVTKQTDPNDRMAYKVMLPVSAVTNPIIKHIKQGRGGQIVVPSWISAAAGLRGLPYWLQEGIRGVHSMIIRKRDIKEQAHFTSSSG